MRKKAILKNGIFLISISALLICFTNPGYALLMDDANDQDIADTSSATINAQGMLINKEEPYTGAGFQSTGLTSSQVAQLPQSPYSRFDKTDSAGNEKSPEYAQGEVLVKFKDGSDPNKVLASLNLQPKNIERVYSVKKAVTKFKKDYKLEKDSEGWYSFLGKSYKEVSDIPDEKAFQEAYSKMPETEKALYRSYKVILLEGVSVKAAVKMLSSDPNVEYAEPNYVMKIKDYPQTLPNDTYVDPDHDNAWSTGAWNQAYEDMWGLKNIEADKAWPDSQGEGVIVAVIDTGADYNHEDLSENIWTNTGEIPGNGLDDDGNGFVDDTKGWNFAYNIDDPMDENGHGTHVSGTIAALGNNDKGIIGVAPKAKVMLLKGLTDYGSGYIDDLANCIVYAASNGAKVLNNSWGPAGRLPSLRVIEDAIDYAHSLGCVAIFAAGNSGDDAAFYSPANYSKVISVAASTPLDKKASFSNWGWQVSVTAPGGDNEPFNPDIISGVSSILSLDASGGDNFIVNRGKWREDTTVGKNYLRLPGTSMACPHVSAVAALIMSYSKNALGKELLPDEVKEIIKLSADPIIDPFGTGANLGLYNQITGAGRINARKAIEVCRNNPSITNVKITSPQNFSNWANHPNVAICGMVSGEDITVNKVSLEYTFSSDTDYITVKDVSIQWTSCQGVTFDTVTGAVNGAIDLSAKPQGWLTIRLKADTLSGAIYDFIVLRVDYLELFQIVEPDFESYGHGRDLLLGRKGQLKVTYSVPVLDYQRLGMKVELTAELQGHILSTPLKIGSVTNPPAGTWTCALDTTRTKDDISYDIVFSKKMTVSGKTYSTIESFYRYTMGGEYHINNTNIYTPYHNSIYRKQAGPIEITGYSVSPIKRLEASVGHAPGAWRTLPITVTAQDGFSGFTSEVNPADFDLSYYNLINIRVINDVRGKEVENECVAIIIADEDMDPAWPNRSAHYQGAVEAGVGDVDGDRKDEVVVATEKADFIWTTKDYYNNQIMQSLSRCYIYHENGRLDETALSNSEEIMRQDTAGVGRQFPTHLSLVNLDDIPGKEIVMMLSKALTKCLFLRKNELLALDMNGLYPQGWARHVDDDFSVKSTQRMAALDADRDGTSEIFLDSLIGSLSDFPFKIETRRLSLIDSQGRTIVEKDAGEMFPDVWNNYIGDSLVSGDIDRKGSNDIFININNKIPRGDRPDLLRVKPHPLLLDAATLDVIKELPLPPDDGVSNRIHVSPVAANLDDDKDLELLFMEGQYETVGRLSAVNNKIYAYNPDGTVVPGWPYSPALPSDPEWWRVKEFKVIDIDRNGKAEVMVEEEWLDPANNLADHLRIKFIDSSAKQVPGWPIALPDYYYISLDNMIVLDIDDDGRMEFILPVFLGNQRYKDGLGDYGFISRFRPYGIVFFENDGNISGIKYVPGYPRLAAGNIDDDPATELVAVYDHTDINMSDTHEPGIYNEIVAFDITSSHKPESIPWSQALGNAQRTNIYEKPNTTPPVIGPIGCKVINENQSLSFTITASDSEGRRLLYQEPSGMPIGAVFTDNDNGTALFTWAPDYNQAGAYNVTFTVSDGDLTASETITITVNNVNRPPVIVPIGNKTVDEGKPLTFTILAKDPDNDQLIYSAKDLPNGVTLDSATGLFSWKPTYYQAGTYKVTFTVSDGSLTASDTVTITVRNINGPPQIEPIGDKTVNRWECLGFKVKATDPDNDPIFYYLTDKPQGAHISIRTGVFYWRLNLNQVGDFKVTVLVRDSKGNQSSETITITVPNSPPVLSPIGDKMVRPGQTLFFRLTANDPDRMDYNGLRFYVDSLPRGAYLHPIIGVFHWRPNKTQTGTYRIKFGVKDPAGLGDEKTVTINVE